MKSRIYERIGEKDGVFCLLGCLRVAPWYKVGCEESKGLGAE